MLVGHRYQKTSPKLKPLKLRIKSRLTVDQKCRRLDFAKAHKNWTIITGVTSFSVTRLRLSSVKSLTARTTGSGPTAHFRRDGHFGPQTRVLLVKLICNGTFWKWLFYIVFLLVNCAVCPPPPPKKTTAPLEVPLSSPWSRV